MAKEVSKQPVKNLPEVRICRDWLWRVERPRSRWESVGVHFPWALISGGLLFAALFVPLQRLPIWPCTFLRLTGYPCPFCGATRAFMDMAHGRFAMAFGEHPWAAGLYVLTALVFAWNAAALLCGVVLRRGQWFKPSRKVRVALWTLLLAGLAVTWIYRLILGLK